uniref:Uncharacterized protein n=1 Tax=Pseudomonas phage Touem01 TaxID=3138548 RepID=A0AAU6W1K7_9VIRU
MSLILDLTPVSPHATDAALELLFKSTHDHDKGIWNPHESALIRRLVELFSDRGLDRLEHVKQEIIKWESGQHHKPGATSPATVPGMMTRWSDAELGLVRVYLESLPPDGWTLDDHMMAVDYVVQRYLPAEEMRTEAEWMSTRASLMGKVQANMSAEATPKQADNILAALPSTAAAANHQFKLNLQQRSVMAFGNVRAAENVRALAEDVRHRMRGTIMQHLEQQQTLAPGVPGEALQSKLVDQFAMLNRDWRRIAVTEAGECQTQGFIASLAPGTKVKRIEQYASACNFCKKIHGKIATVVSPDKPDKDWENEIWVGKNNIGRSASPRKRVGDTLVDRDLDEMWTLPAGLAHPHCRGRWVLVDAGTQAGDDADFAAWLDITLA